MDPGIDGSSDPRDVSPSGANNSRRVQESNDRRLSDIDGSTSEGESVAAVAEGRTATGTDNGETDKTDDPPPREEEGEPPKKKMKSTTGAADGKPAEIEEPPQQAEEPPPKKKTKEGHLSGDQAQKVLDVRWENMFAHLEAYRDQYGDTNVPAPQRGCKQKGEYDYLFRWSERNREQYRLYLYSSSRESPITPYRIAKLQSLNFTFVKSGDKWRAMYERLKRFKYENGHSNPNAKNADTKELKDLTRWVQGQRAVFASLAAGRSREDATTLRPKIQLLRDLGVEFHAVAQASWEDHLVTLKRRIAERDEGVEQKDSFLQDEERELFFTWMNEQRGAYRAAVAGKTDEGGAALRGMTVERLAKLIDAGMDFNPVETRRREAKIRAEATKAAVEEAAPAPAWTAEAVRAFAASAEASTDAPPGESPSGSPSMINTRDTDIPNGLRTTSGVLLLANPRDRKYLSETLAVVRENVEVFTATKADVESRKGRPVVVGLVGLRCIHCWCTHCCRPKQAAAAPRTRRAVCYPSSVKALYRTVVDMKADHFTACRSVPLAIKEELAALKAGNDQSKSTTLRYFMKAAKKMGMVDGPNGVTYVGPGGNQIDTPSTSEGTPTNRQPSARPLGSTRKRKRKASVKDASGEKSNEVGDYSTAPTKGKAAVKT